MKKNILTVITAALILANLTGCNNSDETQDSKNNISSTESTLQPESSAEDSTAESSTQSDPESVPEPVPVESTDEDRELQEILAELYEPTSAINRWFCHFKVSTSDYPDAFDWRLEIPEISFWGVYIQVPDNYYTATKSFCVPTTKAGMEELFQKYFTKEMTASLMRRFTVCESIEKSDKTITLKLKYPESYERVTNCFQFIEVDGHLYAAEGFGSFGFIVPKTAKVTKKTDDTIEFTYITSQFYDISPEDRLEDTTLYLEAAENGSIKLEDGVWKLHTWDDWHFPLEPMPY